MKHHSEERKAELDWLAFRFISGEMDARQEEAFCQRLADEQSLREAVADAVELTQSISLATHSAPQQVELLKVAPSSKRKSHWMRSGVWMALGGVCCLVLVALFQSFGQPDESQNSGPRGNGLLESGLSSGDTTATHMLAITWSEIHSQWPVEEGPFEEGSAEGDENLLGDQTPLLLSDEEAISAPTWILAAVGAPVEDAESVGPDQTDLHN